jgi:uncharacterized protein (TIGR02594 family)
MTKNLVQTPLVPWMSWGINELQFNIAEMPGKEANPRIIEYHSHVSLKSTSDEVPWCSSALNCCFYECGMKGTNSAAARSWLGWGTAVKFRQGAIAVFWRSRPDGAEGHVGIALAEDLSTVTILGGNQSNSWCIIKMARHKLLGYRWPLEFDLTQYYKIGGE